MRRGSRFIALPIVLASLLFSACLDEISAIFEIVAYEESEDPEVRDVGEVLAEVRVAREVRTLERQFLETGDGKHLDAALELQPDDTALHGYNVALATLGGDPAQIKAAKSGLALAEARRLASLSEPGDPATTPAQIRRNVLGEILVAQTRMLGGSLNTQWSPPPADATLETQQLFADYCATVNEIRTHFGDDLSYISTPPCP